MKARVLLIGAAFVFSFSQAIASNNNGPSFTAVVGSDGTLARGLNAVSVTRQDPGVYVVLFSKDVRACSYTAAIGLPGATGASGIGIVTVARRSGKPKGLFIETFDAQGNEADLGFHLIGQC